MPAASVPIIKKSTSLPTILIAGGAGFLGSHLAEKLLETQCRVVALDNLSTGRRSFIQTLTTHPRFVFVDADINKKIPQEIQSVNYIFHLAALEIYQSGRKDLSFDALLTNSLGTRNLLKLAKKSKAKFLLASSIEVYRGLLSAESLEHYFGGSWEQQRRATHAEAKRFAEALVWEAYEDDNQDVRIARLGEVYGPRMDLRSAGTLGRLIEELLSGGDLTVYGEGLKKEYYTHVDDVVRGLVRALFSEGSSGKIYPLTSLESTTPLELVYLLKDLVEKDVRVVFKPPLDKTALPELNIVDGELQHELGWEPSITLKDGLVEVLQEKGLKLKTTESTEEIRKKEEKEKEVPVILPQAPPKVDITTKKVAEKKPRLPLKIPNLVKKFKLPKPTRNSLKIATLPAAGLAFWFLIFPATSFAFKIRTGQAQLKEFEQSVRKLDLESSAQQAEEAQVALLAAKTQLERMHWLFVMSRQQKTYDDMSALLQSAAFLSAALRNEAQGALPLAKALSRLISAEGEKEEIPVSSQASLEFRQAQENVLLAEAYLKKIAARPHPRLAPYKDSLTAVITRLKTETPILNTISAEIPLILGNRSPQTYLVLFQNSNELRPTGGFIGSYGKVLLDKGVLAEILVDDIYNLDGVIEAKNIKLDPPPPLREHLGVDKYLLRDANWDPDFPRTAQQIQSLYALANEEDIAGVIAVDLQTIEKLLEIVGPIYLAQFNETITAENFFEKTEFYSEAGYYPGSPQKKTFLSLATAKIIEKLVHLEVANFARLAVAVSDLLNEKHILIYYPRGKIANLLKDKNWDGRLVSKSGDDYLMVVDANVGATKANYYVKRSINYAVKNIDRQGTLEATLTINYIHGAASNSWPGGAYKNYVRVFVPEGSHLKKVVRSSEGVDSKDLEITSEVNQGVIEDKTVWGTVFTLDAGKTLSLTFIYDLPASLALKPDTRDYSLFVQKQPGTVADPLTVEFLTPFGRTVLKTPEGSERVGNLWRYQGNLRRDVELRFLLK